MKIPTRVFTFMTYALCMLSSSFTSISLTIALGFGVVMSSIWDLSTEINDKKQD
jgi:hypothetical protein